MPRNHSLLHPADQIVDIMARIYSFGMTTTSGGNLSIMDSDGVMWISPGGIDKGTLTRDDIVAVHPDGKIVGRHKPSSEYPFHRSVYKMRPGIKAVLHAHPPALVAFSVAGIVPDTTILPLARERCGRIGFAPYDVPGSEALGAKVGAEFKKGFNAILLENHGTCIGASTLLEAFECFETLDFAARTQRNACLLGKPVSLSAQELKLAAPVLPQYSPLRKTRYSSAEAETRRTMAQLIRRAYRQQLFTSTSGTFAARLDEKSFLITPECFDRAALAPEDLVLVQGRSCTEGAMPSRFAPLVARFFKAQPDMRTVMFATPPNLMAYAVAHEPFDPRVIPESYILLREMPCLPFATPFAAPAKFAAALCPRNPVILVENNFVATAGTTLLEPFDRLEVAEYSAKATLAVRSIGSMKPIDAHQIADIVDAFHLIP